MKSILGTFMLAVLVTACGKGAHHVDSLSPEERDRMQESLRNKHYPSRQEVKSSNIQFDDACETFRKTIPADWTQGLVEVPEDPANPAGRKIDVFYWGKIKPGITPTVFFNGGPGSDDHYSFELLREKAAQTGKDANTSFVFIDQRGNGCSDYYPQGNDEETLQRLTHYGSRGIVADAEAVRERLLGSRPWNIFGQSYGSFIVHRYSMVAPRGVKAALGHGSAITDDGYFRTFNRIKAQPKVREDCLREYPEDRAVLNFLGTHLTNDVCFQDDQSSLRVCGYDLLGSTIPAWIAFHDQWHSLHSWLKWFVKDNQLDIYELSSFAAHFYFSENRVPVGGVNYNAQKYAQRVISWHDRGEAPEDLLNCRRIRDDLRAQGIDISQDVTTECAWAMQIDDKEVAKDSQAPYKFLPRDLMKVWDFRTALADHPELQFHLYSGELDQTVPRENFLPEVNAAQLLSNFHYTHFLHSGHDGFVNEAQVWDDLVSESQN